jgi:hypothetical protein
VRNSLEGGTYSQDWVEFPPAPRKKWLQRNFIALYLIFLVCRTGIE